MYGSRCYRLPDDSWPAEDRRRWEELASSDFDRFGPENDFAELTATTLRVLKSEYSAFLGFVAKERPEQLNLPLRTRLDRPLAQEWLKSLFPLYQGQTIGVKVDRVRCALSALTNKSDWEWLRPLAQAARSRSLLKPKEFPRVRVEALLVLGLRLMDESDEEVSKVGVNRRLATKYRNGLMIAFLATTPLRCGTLSKLRIGRQFAKAGTWYLNIPAEDTKTRVPLEYDIPPFLSERFDIFLEQYRPRFKGAADHDYLWPSEHGGGLATGIYQAITRETYLAFGVRVNPHWFRHAAATFWSEYDPANVRGAKDLLGHSSFETTEKHYIMAQSRMAGRNYATILAKHGKSRPSLRVRKRVRRSGRHLSAPATLPSRQRAMAAAGTSQAKQALA